MATCWKAPPSYKKSPANLASQMRNGIRQHRLWPQLTGRAADDPQYLRRRRLLLERLLQLARVLLPDLEQAGVFDGDHRLVGEGCHQVDLPWRGGCHARAVERKQAHRAVTAQQRHAEHAAGTRDAREVAERVLGVGLDAGNVHGAALVTVRPASEPRSSTWPILLKASTISGG